MLGARGRGPVTEGNRYSDFGRNREKTLLLQKAFDYHLTITRFSDLPTVLELSGLCCLPEDYSACNLIDSIVELLLCLT